MPLTKLCKFKRLSYNTHDLRAQLIPQYEKFHNVRVLQLDCTNQTQLESTDSQVQTYPGNPKNQWTQYEFEINERFQTIWLTNEEEKDNIVDKVKLFFNIFSKSFNDITK